MQRQNESVFCLLNRYCGEHQFSRWMIYNDYVCLISNMSLSANPRKMNFKQKKEPPLKKRKAEPPPGNFGADM